MEKKISKRLMGVLVSGLSVALLMGCISSNSYAASPNKAEIKMLTKEEIKEQKEKRKREKKEIKEMEKKGWELSFLDNFEGDELDTSKWSHSPEWKRKDGYWSNDEAFLDGKGNLIIQISERDGNYYSGAVTTRGKFEQAYGYYEMRAKLPNDEGFWSAFWLMTDGAHTVGDEGRDGTEIDIVETPFAYKNNDTVVHALHWDGYGEDHKSAGAYPVVPGIYEGFHTFALDWNEKEYIFYIDGKETWRTDAGGVSRVPAFVQITAEVGTWGGNVKNANLPAQMVVDYVRVYEKNNKQRD
ncbi:glycoside hydrolase family 16 protein [Neobacillus kokaensis]|uniref:GH16 domain-containing protein n=1 Tax=Neobacillus kokaensis TaxID=2759023 RepID=A0ABQ3N8L5_9BACI|nr:glycoside hydrolase family 16 protein [Neobacillus kokaensis]GHI00394.1 hypothetical protein AM1BK_39360 [Neobacillus kokaensis]